MSEQQAPPGAVDHSAVFARARVLVQAKTELDRLGALVDEQKKIKDAAEAFLLEAFANEPGLGGIKVDGYTVYSKRQLFANASDKAAGYEALVGAGYEEFAQKGFNANSVSALFRDFDRNGEQPPPELAAVFTIAERYSIGMTKS